jgi:hypothetical protein
MVRPTSSRFQADEVVLDDINTSNTVFTGESVCSKEELSWLRLRRPIGTFYLLAQKLVFCKLKSRQIAYEDAYDLFVPHGRVPHGRASYGRALHGDTLHGHVSHGRVPYRRHLIGVYFTGVHLTGVHLVDVYL